MATTIEVGKAFWAGKALKGSSVSSSGDILYSYATAILQRLDNGKVIGNLTKYSVTTNKHQSQCSVSNADILVNGVQRGATDLLNYSSRPYVKK